MLQYQRNLDAPIAQLDRASDYESAGRGFKSSWARLGFGNWIAYMAGASLDIRGKGQKQVSDITRKEKGQGLEWFAFMLALPFHSKGVGDILIIHYIN